MNKVQLYSTYVCPYAQRTRLALYEKGVDFELIEVDLQNAPEWFLELSPTGKVPVLTVGNDVVWESSVINEYIDEIFPNSVLMPKDPGQRARSRIWIEYANNEFMAPLLKLMFEKDDTKQAEYADALVGCLDYIDQEGFTTASSFWMGEENVTLVDFAFYPFFERFSVLEHYRDFTISSELNNIHDWLDNMKMLPAVQATMKSPEFHIQEFSQWLVH